MGGGRGEGNATFPPPHPLSPPSQGGGNNFSSLPAGIAPPLASHPSPARRASFSLPFPEVVEGGGRQLSSRVLPVSAEGGDARAGGRHRLLRLSPPQSQPPSFPPACPQTGSSIATNMAAAQSPSKKRQNQLSRELPHSTCSISPPR